MAPLEIMNSMPRDDAFLSLLSSQRELLHQFKMEKQAHHGAADGPVNPPEAQKRGSILGSLDPLFLMNTPLIERRGSLDLLSTRRLSLGIGNDFIIPENSFSDSMELKFSGASKFDQEFYEPISRSKRRRSSLGFTATSFFDEAAHPASRRLSMISCFPKAEGDQGGFGTFDDFPTREHEKRVRLDPSIDQATLKSNLEKFSSAMEKSTKSQQDIHNWDKKMGLKRSHSKTMRLSMRSRKKLRLLMKKEISGLLQASK